jgi:hypothetical protein
MVVRKYSSHVSRSCFHKLSTVDKPFDLITAAACMIKREQKTEQKDRKKIELPHEKQCLVLFPC